MARLPIPHQDTNVWGDILNSFLEVEHLPSGRLAIRTDGTLDKYYKRPQFDRIDNTADKDKPLSQATEQALAAKADKTELDDLIALTIALA